MFVTYEELKLLEEKYCEELKNAQAHLDVVREILKFVESKPVVEENEESNEFEVNSIE